ncbi:MAG: hypothetical protein RL385_170 [Pseudomonadota bacterium]|jgi:siderophore synthetase component/RimJ/RimL family protein N-acetyltransferase
MSMLDPTVSRGDAASDPHRASEAQEAVVRMRPLALGTDAELLYAWVSSEHATYWGLVGKTREEVRLAYVEILRNADVFVGEIDGVPSFLLERYDPSTDEVAAHFEVLPGDMGMHVLVAPCQVREPGFTRRVFRVVLDFLFRDPLVRRVVVEPDVRNERIHRLNRWAGFRYQTLARLPHKLAHVATCTEPDFRRAIRRAEAAELLASTRAPTPTTHLTDEHWARENRAIACKALSEWAHERLISPKPRGMAGEALAYEVSSDVCGVAYRFCARRMPLEHWAIDASSVERVVDGRAVELDAGQLVLDLRTQLGLSDATTPTYVEELLSTLYAGTYRRAEQSLTAQDLLHADFQEVEGAMTAGHPCFVANGGRVGFDIRDHAEYAPEAARPVKLLWLAAHREHAQFRAIDARDHAAWMDDILGECTRERFQSMLVRRGLTVSDYVFVPAHPWQWRNKLRAMMAADLSAERLVFLGESEDVYQAQQSVRTFFNRSRPAAPYVKVALSVRNMGFMRGLSAEYMAVTPAINAHLSQLVDADPFFAEHGFALLREVASVGYRSKVLEAVLPAKSPYRKMLAGLYRESPVTHVHSHARLCTMAALLHRDAAGKALLPLMIQASGLSVDGWLDRYFRAYLLPLVHSFYRYGLVFMPHGENVILELDGFVPKRVFMKDLAEEAVIMDVPQGELPPEVRRIYLNVPEDVRTLSIFTDVFDGVFRFIAQILEEELGYSHSSFWSAVRSCLLVYVDEHEQWVCQKPLQSLFARTFRHSCLNRLQLRDSGQMVDLLDPAASLLFAGELDNPIAFG